MRRFVSLMPRGLIGGAALALTALSAAAQEPPNHLILNGIPSATAAPSGIGFVQISGTDNNHNDTVDGSIALGFGLGDAAAGIGVQTTLHLTSLSDFGGSGYLSMKFSRALTDRLYGALEVSHLAGWGEAEDIDPNVSAVLSYFGLISVGGGSYPVILSAGFGERLRWDETEAKSAGFIGIGVGFSETFAGSLAYTGDDWEIGLGARVNEALTLTASVEDVFDQNDARKVVLSANFAFHLFGR